MNLQNRAGNSHSKVSVLWALIIAKCLIAEYLVQSFSVPINSVAFIWFPTLLMAMFATMLFLNANATDFFHKKRISGLQLTWAVCAITGILATTVIFVSPRLNPFTIPAILSGLMGIGCLNHGITLKSNAHLFSGIGWFVGAAVLTTSNELDSLLIFAFLTVFLTTLPKIKTS